jgi:hypothetical protein
MSPGAWRAGVRFDCEHCGRLLKDDRTHGETLGGSCPACNGDVALVGIGNAQVTFARWYRCRKCRRLYLRRAKELVAAKPRAGFEEFTTF